MFARQCFHCCFVLETHQRCKCVVFLMNLYLFSLTIFISRFHKYAILCVLLFCFVVYVCVCVCFESQVHVVHRLLEAHLINQIYLKWIGKENLKWTKWIGKKKNKYDLFFVCVLCIVYCVCVCVGFCGYAFCFVCVYVSRCWLWLLCAFLDVFVLYSSNNHKCFFFFFCVSCLCFLFDF